MDFRNRNHRALYNSLTTYTIAHPTKERTAEEYYNRAFTDEEKRENLEILGPALSSAMSSPRRYSTWMYTYHIVSVDGSTPQAKYGTFTYGYKALKTRVLGKSKEVRKRVRFMEKRLKDSYGGNPKLEFALVETVGFKEFVPVLRIKGPFSATVEDIANKRAKAESWKSEIEDSIAYNQFLLAKLDEVLNPSDETETT